MGPGLYGMQYIRVPYREGSWAPGFHAVANSPWVECKWQTPPHTQTTPGAGRRGKREGG
jgi:hypothetical protein